MVQSTDEFLQLVTKSGLVDQVALDDFVANAKLNEKPSSVGDALIQCGLLSHWQNSKLQKGRWKGMCLGKYRVIEKIASGGMGRVYLARHKTLGNNVAIKVLAEDYRKSPNAAKRFLREAKVAANLNHPNITRTLRYRSESAKLNSL